MINSFIGSLMNMKCDVYTQQNYQKDSGAISKKWIFHKTVDCKIEPLSVGGSTSRTDNKTFGVSGVFEYDENFQLKMKTLVPMSRRWRVSAVKSNDNYSIYREIDRYGEPDMIFEVTATHAEIDPLGKVSYYETILKRVQVQNNDTDNN